MSAWQTLPVNVPGLQGPPGPAGNPTVWGMYNWAGIAGPPAAGEIAGAEPSQGGGKLFINQLDRRGYDYSFSTLKPGDRCTLRATDGSWTQIVVAGRSVSGGFVAITYSLMDGGAGTLVGKTVEITALGPELNQVGTLVPGPPGPQGPIGPDEVAVGVDTPSGPVELWVDIGGSVSTTTGPTMLLIDAGASIPADTPAGTVIVEKA